MTGKDKGQTSEVLICLVDLATPAYACDSRDHLTIGIFQDIHILNLNGV